MSAVASRLFLLMAIVVATSACASEPERQWYKPGGNYTMAEFQRDEAACTKNKALDEQCMKDLGWVAISTDPYRGAPPMQGGPPAAKQRYAPK